MRTAAAARGRGVASSLLEHLIAEAVRRAYTRLSLETGTQPFFEPARRLYTRYGFTSCPPFADYRRDPNSTFMTRRLTLPLASAPRGNRSGCPALRHNKSGRPGI